MIIEKQVKHNIKPKRTLELITKKTRINYEVFYVCEEKKLYKMNEAH